MRGAEEHAQRAVQPEDRAALLDSLILCKFLRGAFDDLEVEAAELLADVTGWDVSGPELAQVAKRVVNARKAFNIREGWSPADDTLPARFLSQPLEQGAARGASLNRAQLDGMITAYNRARGWSSEGYLSAADLDELGLDRESRA